MLSIVYLDQGRQIRKAHLSTMFDRVPRCAGIARRKADLSTMFDRVPAALALRGSQSLSLPNVRAHMTTFANAKES